MQRFTERLRRECLSLPTEERVRLINLLSKSVADERYETQRAMLERGADVIRELFGVDVSARTRFRSVVDARQVFCYRMRQEGMYYRTFGEFLGLDHSTVLYYCERMADAFELPKMYADMVEKSRRFDEALCGMNF